MIYYVMHYIYLCTPHLLLIVSHLRVILLEIKFASKVMFLLKICYCILLTYSNLLIAVATKMVPLEIKSLNQK